MKKNMIVSLSLILCLVSQVGRTAELIGQNFASLMNFGMHALSTNVSNGKNLVVIGNAVLEYSDQSNSLIEQTIGSLTDALTDGEIVSDEGRLVLAVEFDNSECLTLLIESIQIFTCTPGQSSRSKILALTVDNRGNIKKIYTHRIALAENSYIELANIRTTRTQSVREEFKASIVLSYELNGTKTNLKLSKGNFFRY